MRFEQWLRDKKRGRIPIRAINDGMCECHKDRLDRSSACLQHGIKANNHFSPMTLNGYKLTWGAL